MSGKTSKHLSWYIQIQFSSRWCLLNPDRFCIQSGQPPASSSQPHSWPKSGMYHEVNLIPSNSLFNLLENIFPGLFTYYFIQDGLPLIHLKASTSVMDISRIIFLKRWVALITYLFEWIAFNYNTKDSEFKYEPHLTISPQLLGVMSLYAFCSTPVSYSQPHSRPRYHKTNLINLFVQHN